MEKKFPKIGVGVMIQNERGEVLMGSRLAPTPGEWCFPGGMLEFGESILEAAIRETKEEAGLEISDLKLIAVTEKGRDMEITGKHYVTIGFKAGKYKGEPRLMEPDKFTEWHWFGLDNLPEKMMQATELMIKNFKEGKIY